MKPLRARALSVALLAAAFGGPTIMAAQFEDVPVPVELDAFDFMLGEWTVEGTFRTPDLVGDDRRLWYSTRGGGVTAFDGSAWTAFQAGSTVSDSIAGRTQSPTEPYRFANRMTVTRIQDRYVLLIDEGRTSGTTLVHVDPASGHLVATALHAPTGGLTHATADIGSTTPVFEGRGTDRRGDRIFRRSYRRHGADHFTIRTDVSFDGGLTWIDGQIVQEVRRR